MRAGGGGQEGTRMQGGPERQGAYAGRIPIVLRAHLDGLVATQPRSTEPSGTKIFIKF
jgi:hypothetical protein